MIIAAALIGLAAPAASGATASVNQAMNSAVVLGCFLHASGLSPIVAARRKEIAAAGLTYVSAPPAEFASEVARGMPAAWGKPQFAKVTWPGGDAWVVGFEKGQCLIDAKSSDGPALVQALHDQFEAPGAPWRKLPPADAPDRYAAAVTPPGRSSIAIVANMVGMDTISTGRREVITFDVTPNTDSH